LFIRGRVRRVAQQLSFFPEDLGVVHDTVTAGRGTSTLYTQRSSRGWPGGDSRSAGSPTLPDTRLCWTIVTTRAAKRVTADQDEAVQCGTRNAGASRAATSPFLIRSSFASNMGIRDPHCRVSTGTSLTTDVLTECVAAPQMLEPRQPGCQQCVRLHENTGPSRRQLPGHGAYRSFLHRSLSLRLYTLVKHEKPACRFITSLCDKARRRMNYEFGIDAVGA
jgi:hypothetical protein